MTSHYPGAHCEPCTKRPDQEPHHERCLGWTGPVWCGCTDGLCGIRLLTGLMWDITEPDQGDEQ